MEITTEVKKNDELVSLMDEKYPDSNWTAWINEEKKEASLATWNSNGKNFRRDYVYDGEFSVNKFVDVVIDTLENI